MERIVPKELDYGRNVSDCRTGCVAFPVRNCGSVNADLVGNLPLEKFEVEAAGADVVA